MVTMQNRTYWIFGAGHFGRLACERLRSQWPSAKIRVVDRKKVAVPTGVDLVVEDGVAYLHRHLKPHTEAWIIPAVPIHLAYEWIARQLKPRLAFLPRAVPDHLMSVLPNACRGLNGQVYLSNADFRCPDDCPETQAICRHTQQPRPRSMHTYLARLVCEGYTSKVVRSFQLAPGVGGFKAQTLWVLHQALLASKGRFLLSTACKCHAVMNAFSVNS